MRVAFAAIAVSALFGMGPVVGDGPCTVHVIGDSVTVPVARQLERDLRKRGWHARVDARSGRTVREAAAIAWRSNADTIILAVGANRPTKVSIPARSALVTVEGQHGWNRWARSRGNALDWARYAKARGWTTKDGKHYSRAVTSARGRWLARNIHCRKV